MPIRSTQFFRTGGFIQRASFCLPKGSAGPSMGLIISAWAVCLLPHASLRCSLPVCVCEQQLAVAQTKAWIEDVVVRLRLCPYAREPFVGDTIRYAVTDAKKMAPF